GPSRLDHLHTLHGAFLKRSALAPLALVAASFLPGRERQVLLAAVLTVGVIAEVRPAHAQPGPASIVRVRVADSAGTPLGAAGVVIMRGLHEMLAQGITDSAGRRTLAFHADTGDFQVLARKIGFARGDQFFRIKKWDTLSVSIVLTRLTPTLE